MNPATVYTQIRAQCNETADSSGLWSDSEILRHMSVGETIISQTVPCCQDTSSFAAINGTREYNLGSTVGPIFRLTYDSVRLQRIDINDLEDVEGSAYGGIDSSGSPEYYYQYNSTIGMSPIPDGTKTIQMWFQAIPAEIDSSTATAWTIPDRYGSYITSYALWQMFVKDQQLAETAVAYKAEWQDGIDRIRADWNKTAQLDNYSTVRAVDGIFID
jgi:hypothetical protein